MVLPRIFFILKVPTFSLKAFLVFAAISVFLSNSIRANESPQGGGKYSHLTFQHFLDGEGLSGSDNVNAVTGIIQDKQGFMWFSGESGVARYNGIDFEIFHKEADNPRSLSGSYTWDVIEDHDGFIWVATAEGLNRFNPEGHDFTRYTSDVLGEGIQAGAGIGDGVLYSLAIGNDNTLYIASSKGLIQLNPNRTAFSTIPTLSGENIHRVFIDKRGDLWAGTGRQGLYYRNSETGQHRFWRHSPADDGSIPYGAVRAIERDDAGNVWVGTFGGGVARLNSARTQFTRYQHDATDAHSVGSNTILDIHIDKDEVVWIATDPGGLSYYDAQMDGFYSFRNSAYNNKSLGSNKVRTIYSDKLGDLWVGVFPAGVSYFDRSTAIFTNITSIPSDPNSLSHEVVLTFFEDSQKNLWIGTEAGLNLFDRKKQMSTQFLADPNNPHALQFDSILTIEEDVSGELWIGTWSGGAYRFNPETGVFKNYLASDDDPNSIGDAYVWSILRDSKNRIWFGTEKTGLSLYRPETDDFVVFKPNSKDPQSLSFEHVWVVMEDSQQRIWAATTNGLDLLEGIDDGKARFKHYVHDPKDDSSLSSNRIISLMEDSNGYIWVGTQDAGLNRLDPKTGKSLRVSVADGLPSRRISSIIEDDRGYIWVSTVRGVAMINPVAMSVRTFSEGNGLASNNYNRNASYKGADGVLFFGGSKGVSFFNPSSFSEEPQPPEVVISNLLLFNQPVYVNSKDSPLKKPIGELDEIVLSYQSSMFAFEFFAVNYRVSNRNKYSYRLEGFDQHWNDVSSNLATYTNIDPGTYIFRVRGANSSGVWNEKGKSIKVIITPPWWNTTLAYCTFIIIFGAVLWWLMINQRKKIELINERELNKKLMKLDRIKDSFLANTSHELRTPLNGIIGLAESLLDGTMGPVNKGMHHSLNMISLSGRRLSNLINDILDYSKLHENQLNIRLVDVSLYSVSNIVVELLSPLIGTKPLKLVNNIPRTAYVSADEERLQQILLNLVGNAIKFTEEGKVQIDAKKIEGAWTVSVADSGFGMTAEDMKSIFNVFTQLDNKETRDQGGTGLGLSIARQLVELHGGALSAQSTLGEGSTFKFNLLEGEKPVEKVKNPLSRSGTGEGSKGGGTGAESAEGESTEGESSEESGTKNVPNNDFSESKIPCDEHLSLLRPFTRCSTHTILIVDDDAVNRLVLSSILSIQKYTVVEAESGSEALRMLASGFAVDLVIMDVMMPKMSGYEACMRLRVDHPVHVLPVLFLTAKHFNEDVVRGFLAGGSDFLTKPVSKHDLLSRVSTHLSMLEISRRLEGKFSKAQKKNANNGRELKVLEHIVEVMNRELDCKKLLKDILEDVQDLVKADQVVYWQVKSEEGHYSIMDADASGVNQLCLYEGDAIVEYLKNLYKDGQHMVVLEDLKSSEILFLTDAFPHSKSSVLMIIFFEGKVVGFITVLINCTAGYFSDEMIGTLNRLHAHMTSAIIKAKLLERLDMDVSVLAAD